MLLHKSIKSITFVCSNRKVNKCLRPVADRSPPHPASFVGAVPRRTWTPILKVSQPHTTFNSSGFASFAFLRPDSSRTICLIHSSMSLIADVVERSVPPTRRWQYSLPRHVASASVTITLQLNIFHVHVQSSSRSLHVSLCHHPSSIFA